MKTKDNIDIGKDTEKNEKFYDFSKYLSEKLNHHHLFHKINIVYSTFCIDVPENTYSLLDEYYNDGKAAIIVLNGSKDDGKAQLIKEHIADNYTTFLYQFDLIDIMPDSFFNLGDYVENSVFLLDKGEDVQKDNWKAIAHFLSKIHGEQIVIILFP